MSDPRMTHPGEREAEDARRRRKIQKQLDDALADSFPASDPVSIVTSQEEEDWGTDAIAPQPSRPERR